MSFSRSGKSIPTAGSAPIWEHKVLYSWIHLSSLPWKPIAMRTCLISELLRYPSQSISPAWKTIPMRSLRPTASIGGAGAFACALAKGAVFARAASRSREQIACNSSSVYWTPVSPESLMSFSRSWTPTPMLGLRPFSVHMVWYSFVHSPGVPPKPVCCAKLMSSPSQRRPSPSASQRRKTSRMSPDRWLEILPGTRPTLASCGCDKLWTTFCRSASAQ
mmetsp:Transcript_106530/g.227515  ORF Transcript_106530/g.227515 Transcript_106530/m.227515 type:complete len:219 (+) Transcript_106530:308-964(+)